MNTLQKVSEIKSQNITAESNIQKLLNKIKEDNEKYNIYLYVNESAIEDAKKLDERIKAGEEVGKLAGLGIAIKANINVKDMPISCASKVLEDYNGTYDADVVKRIKEEDGIILGIVNCDEFASGSTGRNSAFGKTINPACPAVIPGGSSSGSAAVIAGDMADISLGSDTGGSIRCPASHCGIYGIKPSYGRVSRYGLIDLAMSFDQIGPLCKDLEGCALMMEVISGYSTNDTITHEKAVLDYSKPMELENVNVAMAKEFEELCTNKEIYSKVKDVTTNTFNDVHDINLDNVKLAVQTYYPIVYTEFFSGTRKLDGRRFGKKFEEAAGVEALRRALGGNEISKAEFDGKYYRKALQVQELIRNEFDKAFEKVDAIILPTTPELPVGIDQDLSLEDEYASDAYTIPANLAGICAGVVPIGKINDVPVGLQVFCRAFNEKLLFAIMDKVRKTLADQK